MVNAALRPILASLDVPLILAASEPLASIYRSVNSYPGLAAEGVKHTDDRARTATSPPRRRRSWIAGMQRTWRASGSCWAHVRVRGAPIRT